MNTKGETRAARKAAVAAGRPWTAEPNEHGGGYTQVFERTPAEERRHARAMERWARWHDECNGAPESEEDV